MKKLQVLFGFLILGLLAAGHMNVVSAATTAIVGGSNGSSCGSGGYFTPSAVTVADGNTVTISVPSNDPYTGGIQVHGFAEGNFTIARGGSHTTAALHANVSYYGTWPSSGCMKGSGTVTVTAPPAAPPAPVTPPPATTAPTSSTPSSTHASTPAPAAAKPAPAAPTPAPTPAPAVSTTTPTPTTTAPATTTPVVAAKPPHKSSATKIAIGAALNLAAVGTISFATYYFAFRPKP